MALFLCKRETKLGGVLSNGVVSVVRNYSTEAAALEFGLFQAKRACYSGLEPQLIHNNVKSSNVLLDRGG